MWLTDRNSLADSRIMISVVVLIDFVQANYPPSGTLFTPRATQTKADIFVEDSRAVSEHTVLGHKVSVKRQAFSWRIVGLNIAASFSEVA